MKIFRQFSFNFFLFFSLYTIIIPFESIKKEKREEEASSNLFWEKCWRQNSHIIYFNTRTTRTAALYSLYSNTYGTSQVMDVWKITQINFLKHTLFSKEFYLDFLHFLPRFFQRNLIHFFQEFVIILNNFRIFPPIFTWCFNFLWFYYFLF